MKIKKRKERSLRVTLADVLLILLALLAVLLGGIYLYTRQKGEAEVELLCLLRVPSVERSLLEAHDEMLIPEGSVVRTENGTAELGVVREVRVLPHERAVLRDGEVKWLADEAVRDLEIVVRMRGIPRGSDGIRVKDLRIAAGGQGTFRIGNYLARSAELLSVEVIP